MSTVHWLLQLNLVGMSTNLCQSSQHYACMLSVQKCLTAHCQYVAKHYGNRDQSMTHVEGLSCDPSLLRPLTTSQIHQIQLAAGGPLLPVSQHANLTVYCEHCV